MTDDDDWGIALRDLCASIEQLEEFFRKLLDRRERGLEPGFLQVGVELSRTRDQARTVFERLCSQPAGLMVNGYMLSKEQFLLMASRGAVYCTVPTAMAKLTDPYDVFRMFHYQDEDLRCYISLSERPHEHDRIRIRFGRPPEELRWGGLRPEQQEFFEEFLPDVAARFKRGD